MSKVVRELKDEGGRLTWRGIRYMLVRPETMVGVQRAAKNDEAAAAGGFEGGKRTSARLAETMKGRMVLDAMADMGADLGWGTFKVDRFDTSGFDVHVDASAFAEAFGKADAPVCHFIRGVLAGIGTTLMGAATARETECVSAGGKTCRFEVRKP